LVPSLTTWRAYLARRRVLLVLDNAEHAVVGVTGIVHRLLTGCPQVTVLVTSRELLRSPAEAAYAVPPLSLPSDEGDALEVVASDAVTLFNERARAARPGLVMTAADVAATAKICRHLDGIPLAIELAAARIRMLGTHQIEARLDDCLRLLTTGIDKRDGTTSDVAGHARLEP
jgi:predicted ATPase